jgi:CBS domain containing-hemolysin-like protein
MAINILLILLWSMLFSFLFGVEMAFAFSNRLRLQLSKDENLQSRMPSFFFKHSTVFSNILFLAALVVFYLFVHQVFCLMEGHQGLLLVVVPVLSLLLLVAATDAVLRLIDKISPTSFFIAVSSPLFVFYWILYPVEQVLVSIVSMFGLLVRRDRLSFSINRIVRKEEEESQPVTGGEDFGNEVKMFQNALDFSKIRLKDAMVPRTEIVAVDITTSLPDLRSLFVQSHFSRILIYKDNIDNVVGYVHSADMFDNPQSVESMLNPIIVVPEMMTANKLLRLFLKQKKSLALVVDEFGGTSGLLTLEDVMEEIFGEIEDEHDVEGDSGIVSKKIGPNEYLLSGRLEVEDVNDNFGLKLPLSDDYLTIAGLVLDAFGFVPSANAELTIDKRFEVKVIRTSAVRVDLVRLTVFPSDAE